MHRGDIKGEICNSPSLLQLKNGLIRWGGATVLDSPSSVCVFNTTKKYLHFAFWFIENIAATPSWSENGYFLSGMVPMVTLHSSSTISIPKKKRKSHVSGT